MEDLVKAIESLSDQDVSTRVEIYNRVVRALASLVFDICDAPALSPVLVPSGDVSANDYNPNKVASPEMDLLETSIRHDGLTMPVVTYPEPDGGYTVVDGYHRKTVVTERLGWDYIPCSVIDRSRGDRIASTIRHNRARGKHVVPLMADIVRDLMALGWKDDRIAERIGMTPEELLRLKQSVGIAHLLASDEYSQSWGPVGDKTCGPSSH